MCDLICDVNTHCVGSRDTGRISASDKFTFKKQEKKEKKWK